MPFTFFSRKSPQLRGAKEAQRLASAETHANALPNRSAAERLGQRSQAVAQQVAVANAAKQNEDLQRGRAALLGEIRKVGKIRQGKAAVLGEIRQYGRKTAMLGEIRQLGKIQERIARKAEFDTLDAKRRSTGLSAAEETRHGTIKHDLTNDVSALLKYDDKGQVQGLHPVAAHYFDMKNSHQLGVEQAYHGTAEPGVANNIQKEIRSDAAKTDDARMGRAFYVANRMETSRKEMERHLATAHETLRYETSDKEGHIADLTHQLDQRLVERHGHALRDHLDATKPFGPSSMLEIEAGEKGRKARRKRADGIAFPSQADKPNAEGPLDGSLGGTNLALYRNMSKILNTHQESEPTNRGTIVKKWTEQERAAMLQSGHQTKYKPDHQAKLQHTLDELVKRRKD